MLTWNRLATDGVYLLENGMEVFLWVGRGARPALVSALFGVPSFEGIDVTSVQLQVGVAVGWGGLVSGWAGDTGEIGVHVGVVSFRLGAIYVKRGFCPKRTSLPSSIRALGLDTRPALEKNMKTNVRYIQCRWQGDPG